MKHFLLRIEPIVWLLFGQGLLIGTMLLTGWILVVGIAIPLGLVVPEPLAFDRAHALASTLLGRLAPSSLAVLRMPTALVDRDALLTRQGVSASFVLRRLSRRRGARRPRRLSTSA